MTFYPIHTESTTQWGFSDVRCLNKLLSGLSCPKCHSVASVQFNIDSSKRMGFAHYINLMCSLCQHDFGSEYSSGYDKSESPGPSTFTINNMLVLFFNELGLGYSAMQTLGAVFGIKILNNTTFMAKNSQISQLRCDDAQQVLDAAADTVREYYMDLSAEYNEATPLDISVSYDGSWHTRGHRSHYGIGAVIELQTGLVLDYEVLSTFCRKCVLHKKKCIPDSKEDIDWRDEHKQSCNKNYDGSSNSMETEIAKRLWARSIQRHNMQYVGMLGDGDSKAYSAVLQMKPYDVDVEREECINHAHKRMLTALKNVQQKEKLGGRGVGRLTLQKCVEFQSYYGKAIWNNTGSVEDMRDGIWASLRHCMSTDESPSHEQCPEDKWCFYKNAISKEQMPPPHKDNIRNPLSIEVGKALIPIYTRMSDPNLLKRLIKGKTQNNNECFHSVVWSRCPKTTFVGKDRIDGAVARGVSAFNMGARQLSSIKNNLGIEVNSITIMHEDAVNFQRQKKAVLSLKLKESRKESAKTAKVKRLSLVKKEGVTYKPGGF